MIPESKHADRLLSQMFASLFSPVGVIGGVLLVLVIVVTDGAAMELIVPYLLICSVVGPMRPKSRGRDPYDVD